MPSQLTPKLHPNQTFVLIEDKNEEHSVPGYVEPLVIFTILVLNAIVSIYQDYDAERALDSLKDLQSVDALVLREGEWTHIPSKEIVPGDIVQVRPQFF